MFSKPAWLLGGAAAAALGVAFIAMQAAASPDRQNFSLVEKGRYLAIAADCAACHDATDGRSFAGGRPIETPFGNIVASNITPDQETGIGSWSDDDFDNAVRGGVRPDGARLYPAMPYNAYTKMSRDDVLAIRAYLASIQPVRKSVDSNTLPFPFNIRAAMRAWNALYFTEGAFKPDPGKSAEWNRGAFLVDGPGHCAACHTPKTFLGGDKSGEYLRGSYLQGWFAPDITNDDRVGLGRWSPEDVVAYLKTGHNRITAATGPMAEEIAQSTSHMHDDDLKAIATYLKSLPGRGGSATPLPASDPMMVAGQAIYRDQCSACHGLDGKGVPQLFPSLAESSSTRASDPTSLVRVILRGARSVATAAEPTAPGMPSFAWQLDDVQVAAVTTYIRNAWTPSAGAVTAEDVKRLRAELSARTD
jgi:mono/diheme cytochrome c family protein